MRKGQNPAKFVKEVAKPERITAAVLNFIPFLSGFYAEALDVLKVSLESMRNEPGLPFDLMVFDNGSCPEVRDYLVNEKEAGRIQYLILAEKNMGKGGMLSWQARRVKSLPTPIAISFIIPVGSPARWSCSKPSPMSAW
jgi:hypothetical protein